MVRPLKKTSPQHPKTTKVYISGTRTLGLKTLRQDELVRKVKSGFRYKAFVCLKKNTGMTQKCITAFVSIPQSTLSRREKSGKLSPEESDRILRASRIFEMTVALFEGNVDPARQWLQTPTPALAGNTPLEFASTDVGAREVERLIGRLEHGVFA